MIAPELLLGCALGELGPEAEVEVEEHVLSCAECANLYASFVNIGIGVEELVRTGRTTMQLTDTLQLRLEREGLVSRRYVLSPGAIVPCTVGAEDLYSLTTLEADLSHEQRVDLDRGGQRIADIPFDARGVVRLLSSSDVLRKLPTMKLPFRLVGVDAEGRERVLGEYTLDHTAFVP